MSSPFLPRSPPAPPLSSRLPPPAANDPTLAANQAQPFIIRSLKTNAQRCLPQLVCHHGVTGHPAAYFRQANANSSQMLVRLAPEKVMESQRQPLQNCIPT